MSPIFMGQDNLSVQSSAVKMIPEDEKDRLSRNVAKKLQLIFFTFMGPCIVNIFKHNQQDATLHNGIYYYKRSTCFRRFSAYHQELKTVHTASGICRDFSASYRYRG
jgi:hypothetical protein